MKKHSKLALAVVTGMLFVGCTPTPNVPDNTAKCDTKDTCGVTFNVNGQPKANVVVKSGAVVKHSGDVVNNQYVELPNGKYDITVSDVSGYTLSQKAFSVTVQDGRTTANIVFTKNSTGGGNTGGGNNGGGTTPTPQQDVDVSLVVDGLPANQSVKVTISDQNNYPVTSVDVKGNKTIKLKPNTTYKVTGAAVSGYKTPMPKSLVVGTTKTGTRLTYVAANTSTGKANPEIKPVSGGVGKVIAQTDAARGGYYVAGKVKVHAYQAANKADWYEVYLSTTSGDFDASKRIYTNAPGAVGVDEKGLIIDTKTQLAQGQKSIVSVRYWKDGASFIKTFHILPDNLGPQVPDIKPVSKLNPGLTQQMGNWVNKKIVLSFENESTLRDNPVNTDFLPAGIDYVEYFADKKVDGKVNWNDKDNVKSLGKVFVKHPTNGYSLEIDTADKTNGLADGKYEIFAVAVDKLGNVSAINAQNHFVLGVDNTGPTVSEASFKAKDAGTGAVRDEYGNGGVETTSPKPTVVRVKYNTRANCMVDAAGAHAGNIDLLDVVKDSGWISGLAHVENLTSPKYADAGVGMPAGTGDSNHLWSIDGSPLNERLYTRDPATGKLVHRRADPSVVAPALSKPNPDNKVDDISSGDCVYLDVNGLDVNDVKIKFGYQKAPTDLLGNPAVGYKDFTATLKVDNERPENLRFTRLTNSAKADQQIQIEVAATDSVSGLRNDGTYIFGRATYGTAFNGRAVQLTSNDKVNYRIFNPGGDSSKLHIFGVVFDKAGNVSSTRGEVAVTPKGPALVGPLVQGNLFVRAQLGGGNYRNFEVATDLNPIGAGIRKFDIFNEPLPGLPARNVTSFNASDVLAASIYRELNVNNALNRVGFGTADGKIDDLNLSGLQPQAPLFHIHDAESLPNSFVFDTSAAGYHAFHAVVWDKNGNVQNLRRLK